MTTTTTAERVPAHHTAFAPQIEAAFSRECEPTYRLEELVAEARRDMGEARWAALNAEWNAPLDALRGGGNV